MCFFETAKGDWNVKKCRHGDVCMLVYLPRVELGSMPSEGIILSIRLQVDVYFVILPQSRFVSNGCALFFAQNVRGGKNILSNCVKTIDNCDGL